MKAFGGWLAVLPLCFALPMLFKWGLKSTAIRLLAMYGGIFVAVGWWDGNPQWHDEIVGWGVLGGLALLVADRGVRAARGVARRVNRGSRRLEVVGGTAVRNVAEGRLPWRSRVGMTWINTGVWLETRLKQQRKRMVDERRQTMDELRGDFDRDPAPDVWRRRRGRWLEVGRLRHDIDRRRDRR